MNHSSDYIKIIIKKTCKIEICDKDFNKILAILNKKKLNNFLKKFLIPKIQNSLSYSFVKYKSGKLKIKNEFIYIIPEEILIKFLQSTMDEYLQKYADKQ